MWGKRSTTRSRTGYAFWVDRGCWGVGQVDISRARFKRILRSSLLLIAYVYVMGCVALQDDEENGDGSLPYAR